MSRVKRPTGPVMSVLVVAAGVVFFLAGLHVHRFYSPYPDGLTATGTITDLRVGRTTKGTAMYTAVYTFTTNDGRQVSFQDPASGTGRPQVGTRVEVSYRPAEPDRARRVPAFDFWGWLIIALGLLSVASGIRSLVRAVRRSADGETAAL